MGIDWNKWEIEEIDGNTWKWKMDWNDSKIMEIIVDGSILQMWRKSMWKGGNGWKRIIMLGQSKMAFVKN